MRPMPERKPKSGKKSSHWGRWVLLLIVIAALALAVPYLLKRYQMGHAGEASFVGAMRTICTANVNFQYTHPKQGYARSLKELADAAYIDQALGSGEKSGYRFQYVAGKPGPNGIDDYHVSARPMRYGSGWMGDGITSLYSDDGCVIHYTREDRAATAKDPTL